MTLRIFKKNKITMYADIPFLQNCFYSTLFWLLENLQGSPTQPKRTKFSTKLPISKLLIGGGTEYFADILFLQNCGFSTSHSQLDFLQHQMDLTNIYKVDFYQKKSQSFAFQFCSLFGSIYLRQGLITKLKLTDCKQGW